MPTVDVAARGTSKANATKPMAKGTFHNFQACRPRRLRHGDEWRQMAGVSDRRNPIENKMDACVKRSVEEREEPHHSPEPDQRMPLGQPAQRSDAESEAEKPQRPKPCTADDCVVGV
jgi:hypothetical protein